jgi:hypothetical protein
MLVDDAATDAQPWHRRGWLHSQIGSQAGGQAAINRSRQAGQHADSGLVGPPCHPADQKSTAGDDAEGGHVPEGGHGFLPGHICGGAAFGSQCTAGPGGDGVGEGAGGAGGVGVGVGGVGVGVGGGGGAGGVGVGVGA